MAFGKSTLELVIAAKDQASATFKKISNTFSANTDKMIKAGKSMAVAGVAISTAMAVAIKQAAAFQQQMAQVSTMLDKNTMKHMPAFEKAIKDMSMEFGEGTDTLANGLYNILSASVPAEKAISVLDASVKAAKAGLTDTGTAADAITTILNSYGLSADKATDVSDLLFATVKRGKITFAELAPNIGKVAATSAKFGLSMEELGASIATLTRSGIRADLAMTAIRGILNGVVGATEESAKAFKEKLGMELTTATLKSEGLINILSRMKEAGLTPEDIKKMFPNVRGLTGIVAAMGDLEGATFDYNLMVNRAGLTQQAFEKNTNTTQMQLNKLKQGLNLVAVEIGMYLLPHVNKLIDGILSLIKKFREADPSMKKFLSISTAISGAVLSLSGVLLIVVGNIAKFIAAMQTAGIVTAATMAKFTAFAGVIGVVAIATQGLIELIIKYGKAANLAAEANAKAINKQAEANQVLLEKFFEIKKAASELPPELQKSINVTDKMREQILALVSDDNVSTEVRKRNQDELNRKIMALIGSVKEYKKEHIESTQSIIQSTQEQEKTIVKLGEKEIELINSIKKQKELARSTELEQKIAQLAEEERQALLQTEKEIEDVQMREEAKKEIRAIFDEEKIIAHREANEALIEADIEKNQQVLELEQEVTNTLNELTKSEFENKMSLLHQESNERAKKIQLEVKDEQKKKQLLLKNQQIFDKQKEKLDQEALKKEKEIKAEKIATALTVAEKSIQAINFVLEAEGSSAKKRKQLMLFLIGLEKALAIAKMWSAEAGKGLLGIATATLGTARIVAEFAAIKKSLNQTVAPELITTKPTEVEALGGETAVATGEIGTAATTATIGGEEVVQPVAQTGYSGGGVVNINFGGMTLNFDVARLEQLREPAELEFLLREIAEAIKTKTVEATRMAQESFNLGKSLEGEAI